MTETAPQQVPETAPAKPRAYFTYLSACALAACVIVRAPSIFEKGKIPLIDVELKLNAGWLLTLGPLLIFCAALGIAYANRDATRPRLKERCLASIVARVIPCLAAAFLSLQFFLLFAPKGQCNTYPRWKFLTDWKSGAFQPEYCMSLSPETQANMPYLLSPPAINAWAQIILPILVVCVVIADWRHLNRSAAI